MWNETRKAWKGPLISLVINSQQPNCPQKRVLPNHLERPRVGFSTRRVSEDDQVLNQHLQMNEFFQDTLRLAKGVVCHGAGVLYCTVHISALHDLKILRLLWGKRHFQHSFSKSHTFKKKKHRSKTHTPCWEGIHPLCVGTGCSVWNLLVCRKREVY